MWLIKEKKFDKQILEISDAIAENKYNEAYENVNNLLSEANSKQKDEITKRVREILKSDLQNLTSALLDGDKQVDMQIKSEGLGLFKDFSQEIIETELEKVANMYISRQITYEAAISYLENMSRVDAAAQKIDLLKEKVNTYAKSRKAFEKANELYNKGQYTLAADYYAMVIEEEQQDYEIASQRLKECLSKKDELVVYEGPVQHIFFHPLIAYPELAFDNDYISNGYNEWFVTVKEFNRIIETLYERDFILIDINYMWEEAGEGKIKRREMLLPKGKKPLVISIDDLNYYEYMISNGNVHKLILDDEGNIATYTLMEDGKEHIAYDNEIITILDKFVEEHPDFSFEGAKGTIALTGYEGILGYRTDKDGMNSPNYENEKAEAIKVANRLKETGWSFACHSYGHPDTAKISYEEFVEDLDQWIKEVEPLIGPTNVYVYPFGASVTSSDPKFKYMQQNGFNIMCGVGDREYTYFGADFIVLDRRHVDGIALLKQPYELVDLFDPAEVVDSVRPPLN